MIYNPIRYTLSNPTEVKAGIFTKIEVTVYDNKTGERYKTTLSKEVYNLNKALIEVESCIEDTVLGDIEVMFDDLINKIEDYGQERFEDGIENCSCKFN